MFEHRKSGDYGELVRRWLKTAEEFLDAVEKLMRDLK